MAGPNTILNRQHRDRLNRAIRKVLDTELALETYSQIVDGLPLASVAYDQDGPRREGSHPISRHTSLCPGARETARDFLSEFADIDTLAFDAELLRAYQSTQLGHRSFECRLIELVAVAVHKLAALLFKRDHRSHDAFWKTNDPAYTVELVTSWQEDWERPHPYLRPGPTLFSHRSYKASEQYPDKVADIVGYWAENRVLGGVVLFDRSESWNSEPEANVYLHSHRWRVTFKVWQVLDEQQQSLVDFLVSPPAAAAGTCPLPLSASAKNLKRFDPEVATKHKVYRDIWERPENLRGPGSCARNVRDYPELGRIRRLQEANKA